MGNKNIILKGIALLYRNREVAESILVLINVTDQKQIVEINIDNLNIENPDWFRGLVSHKEFDLDGSLISISLTPYQAL